MKSKEQWIEEYKKERMDYLNGLIKNEDRKMRWLNGDLLAQVQLDAWKQGMSDAADICKEWEYAQFASEDIIDKRDAKTNV